MRLLSVAGALSLASIVAACVAEPTARPAENRAPSASASPAFVAEHGLGGQSAEQVVEELDQLELDALPDGLFYLSVAP